MNTATIYPLGFLEETPQEIDKILCKRAYATYLIGTEKTPEESSKEPLNLSELLPILGSLDRKW